MESPFFGNIILSAAAISCNWPDCCQIPGHSAREEEKEKEKEKEKEEEKEKEKEKEEEEDSILWVRCASVNVSLIPP